MSDWWKFDPEPEADESDMEPVIVTLRSCQVCGVAITADRQRWQLSFCQTHLDERAQVIAEVQAQEKRAREALLAIYALAEAHPAYLPYTAQNAIGHLSATVQVVETFLTEQAAARAEVRDKASTEKAQSSSFFSPFTEHMIDEMSIK